MFDWFRRKFGDRDKENKDEQKEQTPAPQEETPDEPEPAETAATSAPQEDYLKWAKAAYQNIQQRQPTEAEPEPVAEPETAPEPVSEVEPEPEPVSEAEPETAPEPVAETEPEPVSEAEPETAPEPVAETESVVEPQPEPVVESEPQPVAETEVESEPQPEPQPVAETEPVVEPQPEPVSEPEPEPEEPATPTPAWMQKSDALERLKETAIETPEPEVEKSSEPKAKPKPYMEFDEEFVWSAQVLADQGRQPDEVSAEEISWLKRLRQGLGKTRRGLVNQLKSVVGQGPLNEDAVMTIEALLLQADVGIEATDYIIETLQEKLREEALPPEQAIAYLKKILRDLLDAPLEGEEDQLFVPEHETLNVWLLAGVNGAGKTTTIGKLAHLAKKSGYTALIAAADTFRAAAVEQVKVWGTRSQTDVIANPGKNTDPAAVVYDAIAAAISRNTELLLVDTAGRLQNKKNLMDELAKIRRIIDKKAPEAKVESLLVLDATLGQNGLRQAQVFAEAAQLSGVVLTKLDGTAKGGVALAVSRQLNLPIRFIGAGEGIEDLRPFSSYEFVEALLSE